MTGAEPRAEARLGGPADPVFLDAVHDTVDRLWATVPDIPAPDRMLFETAVAEVVANVVQHAVPTGPDGVKVEVTLVVDAAELHAEVVDDGAGLPMDLDRGLPADTSPSGRGLVLIQRTVDRFTFERRDGHNVWSLARRYLPR